MQELILNIFTKKFKALENNDLCANITIQEQCNIIHYIIYCTINYNFLNDTDLYKILYLLITKFINLFIIDIIILIKLLDKYKYIQSAKFLKFYQQYQTGKNTVDNMIEHFNNSISRKLLKSITIDDAITNIKILKDIIKSFVDVQFMQILKFKNKSGLWQEINTEEIINRLCQLKRIFGLKLLKNLNIELITLDSFINYSYDEKIKYYLTCVEYINTYFDIILANLNKHFHLKDKIKNFGNIYNGILPKEDNIFIYILDKSIENIPKYTELVDSNITQIVDELFIKKLN